MHVAGMEDSAAAPARQGDGLTAQTAAWLRPGQELCQAILRPEEAQPEAESDHVALLVVLRVAGLAEQLNLGQVLALHGVQFSV